MSKMAQERPKMAQDRPKTGQDELNMAHNRSKASQHRLKAGQDGMTLFLRGSWRLPGAVLGGFLTVLGLSWRPGVPNSM
jgi:hypothetical protein